MKILIVEDEEIQRISLQDDLLDAGYEVIAVVSPKPALDLLNEELFDVILSDLKMPAMDGITFLERVKKNQPEVTVIMMTAFGTVETAVQSMKLGAYDYLTKPFNTDELLMILKRVQKYRAVVAENIQLKMQLETRYSFGKIIGKSQVMQEIYKQLEVVAPSDSTVLLEGETGTGKEMIASAIHYNSLRKDKTFVKVSCAMLSKEILESELFGHERGAFTGAVKQKKGRFELADSGSIFLDEVDDIPVELQVKLLRVLEERSFERVGGTDTLNVDVRVIAATKKNLRQLVEEGLFREDLFYRLNIHPIKLPTLRERKEDIQILFEHFLREFSSNDLPEIAPNVMPYMLDYSWPGNVRELKNVVERLTLSQHCQPILPESLPIEIRSQVSSTTMKPAQLDGRFAFEEAVDKFETNLICEALAKSKGNKAKAADLLSMPVSTLKSKMKKYGID